MGDSKLPEGFACTKIHRATDDSYVSVEAYGDTVRWDAKHLPTKRYRSGIVPDVHTGVAAAEQALGLMRSIPPVALGEWRQDFDGEDWEATICDLTCVVKPDRDDLHEPSDGWEWTVGYSTSGNEPTRELAMERAKAVATAIRGPLASVPT